MAKSIDHVLQPDGTYKWEVSRVKTSKHQETTEVTAPEPKATKKKVTKKKTTSPLSE